MPGIVIFHTLAEAIRSGFQIYNRTSTGYLVRMKTAYGWAMALVEVA